MPSILVRYVVVVRLIQQLTFQVMELRPADVSCLQGRNVVLPGGRDKEGRPILLVSIPPDSPHLDIIPALQYLISIFRYARRLLRGFVINF